MKPLCISSWWARRSQSRRVHSADEPRPQALLAPSADGLLHACGIDKWRGSRRVLAGIDLTVQSGEVLGIIGANGAGKSTLMSILAGLVTPDHGAVLLGGQTLASLGAAARARMGVALQRPGLSPRMTVGELLVFFALCYGSQRPVGTLLERFQLVDKQQAHIRHLSEGQKQRVSLALAFLKDFDVLLLDEPTAGLDPEGRQALGEEIRLARARGAAVVHTTHFMEEAQHWSDRVLVMDAGQQIACASPETLWAQVGDCEKVEIADAQALPDTCLEQVSGVRHMTRHGTRLTLYCQSARDVLQVLMAQDTMPRLSSSGLTLEDIVCLLRHGKADNSAYSWPTPSINGNAPSVSPLR